MTTHRLIALAAPLLLAAASATAVPTATVDGRESVAYAEYFGGFAIAYDGGSDGSLLPLTAFAPSALALDGSHTYNGAYLYWTVTYTVNWQLSQDLTIDSPAHRISGQGTVHLDESSAVVGPNCAPCAASVYITGRNNQALTFTLDASTAYQFHSETTTGQWVELARWDEPAQRWFGLWSGPIENQGLVFDRSGTLQPGRYRLQNNPYDFTADSVPPSWDNAWSYSLTLPDAAITAVPEPAGAALALLGLVVLGWRARRRLPGGPQHPDS